MSTVTPPASPEPAPAPDGPEAEDWKLRLVRAVGTPAALSRVLAVVVALLVAIPVVAAAGADPLTAYDAIFQGAFGSLRAIGDVLNRVDTFLLLGLGIAIGIRAGFFNVGAEGQLWMGALGATVVALYVDVPGGLLIVLSLLAGMLAGALWSGLVAFLKTIFGVDELIGSLMLNYVAILLVGYLTFGPLKAYRAGQTDRTPAATDLPVLIPGTRLHVGFVLAVLAMGLLWWVLNRTTFGYELRTIGGNPRAARFAGIRDTRVIAKVALLGGALCGLAGANAVLGVQHVLLSNFSPGWGYTAIAVALLGGMRPLGILAAAVLFGALEIGATNMQYAVQVPATLGGLIEGLVLVLFLASISITPLVLRWRSRTSARRLARQEGGV